MDFRNVFNPNGLINRVVHIFSKQNSEGDGEEKKKMSKIILDLKDCKLEDKEAREVLMKLDTRIITINERTKNHTIEIRELKNKIKELKNE